MTPVGCRTCGIEVLVKKNSLPHTAVQWRDSSGCVEFALLRGLEERAAARGCLELRSSIEEAVRAGQVDVGSDGTGVVGP